MPSSAKATARHADRVAATLLLLFAIFVILESRALPYWTASAPGPGFLPFWLGALLAFASVALLARTVPARGIERAYAVPDRAATLRLAIVVALTIGAAALSLVAGLVLASGIFMGATLTYLRPGRTRANWTMAAVTAIVVWLLFVRWLAVPLPAGPFGF